MIEEVRDGYDERAEEYTAHAIGEFERVRSDRASLAAFAELAASHHGDAADLGCGPGYITQHLSEHGLSVVGYDISPALIDEARRAYSELQFHVGDFTALEAHDGSFGGIVSRYSLIHTVPSRLASVFAEWQRVLEPGAPLLLSFFASPSADRHGTPFDHAIVTAYELFPPTIELQLRDAGFTDMDVGIRSPLPGARPLDHGTILARKTVSSQA